MICVTTRLSVTAETWFTLTLETYWQIDAVSVDIANGITRGTLIGIANGLAHAIGQGESLVTFTSIAVTFIDAMGVFLARGAKNTLVNIATCLPITGETSLTFARVPVALVDTLSSNAAQSVATCTLIDITNWLTCAILHLETSLANTFEAVTLIDTRGILRAS